MLFDVDTRSSVPVHVQIENLVQLAIASGRLRSGDQLPPVRELSVRLHVNPIAVAKSYHELELMGLLHARRGMGVFINHNIEGRCREECLTRIIARAHKVVTEAKAVGMARQEILAIVEASLLIDAGPYGEIPEELLTLTKPKKTAGIPKR